MLHRAGALFQVRSTHRNANMVQMMVNRPLHPHQSPRPRRGLELFSSYFSSAVSFSTRSDPLEEGLAEAPLGSITEYLEGQLVLETVVRPALLSEVETQVRQRGADL